MTTTSSAVMRRNKYFSEFTKLRGEKQGEGFEQEFKTYDRIIDLLQNEWHMTEEVEMKDAINRKNALLAKVK